MFSHSTNIKEVWKDVAGYEGLYQVSNLGRVRSLDRWTRCGRFGKGRKLWKGKILHGNANTGGNGYPQVSLSKRSKVKIVDVHRLVLETFVGYCPMGMECRHLDGDSSNCRLDNLCWGTFSKNQLDRAVHGTSNHGERNVFAKTTAVVALEVRRLFASGSYTRSQVARKLGISYTIASDIIARRTWNHI